MIRFPRLDNALTFVTFGSLFFEVFDKIMAAQVDESSDGVISRPKAALVLTRVVR